jgi:uncharacterized SAM-binding protein YcdF (DUF218 family)
MQTRTRLLIVAPIVVVAMMMVVVTRAGTFLLVEDTLRPAAAIVVLGGEVPFRPMKAAAIYREGWAQEVWLTQGARSSDEIALEHLGIDRTPEYAYSRAVLERLGVPAGAIRVLPPRNNNTADEVRATAQQLRATGGRRVILVTSSYHSRRVKALWRQLVGLTPEAVVRYTSDGPFNQDRWWADTADAWTVSREWFGLFNAWAGFPVRSEHW